MRFLLEEFEVNEIGSKQQIKYGGKTGFRELTPATKRQERRWRRNREQAYKGSQNHFLAALVNNRLWQEGYLLLEEDNRPSNYTGIPGARPSNRVKNIAIEDILRAGSLASEWVLDFDGYLKVINTNEYSEEQYLEFKDRVAGWQLAEDEDQQTSWLALTRGPVTVTSDGRLNEAYGITKLGYWFFERVAEMLPVEYTPAGSKLFTAARSAPGLPTQPSVPQFDIAREDRFISSVIRSLKADTTETVLERVSSSYLEILERADASTSEVERQIIHKHLAQVLFLLPDSLQDEVLTKEYQHQESVVPIAPDAGHRIASWWRAQDPLPATVFNERVIEHLIRANNAHDQFADQGSLTGFDDRGRVFVRFGPPRTRTVIQTDLLESRKVLQQFAISLPGPMVVPSNEFWAYRHVDDRLQFVFLLQGGRYRIASPEDLIPDELLSASKRTGKRQVASGNAPVNRVDEAYARALVAAYQTIYSDLALHHPMYEEQLQDLEFYESDLRATSSLDISNNQTNLSASPGGLSASSYVQGISSQFTSQAHQARIERDEDAPQQASSILDQVIPLSVAMRPARFRDSTGNTTLEVNWSHVPGTLAMSTDLLKHLSLPDTVSLDRFVVNFTMVGQNTRYTRTSSHQLTYIASNLEQGAPAPVQSFDIPLTDSLAHLSLQWSQHRFRQNEDTGDVDVLEGLKVGTQKIGHLTPLSTDAGVLEMSDPKPIYLGEDNGVFYAADNGDAAPPAYPYTTITSQTPLGLYFEVYELAYDADDQARFTVEYEIVRDARRRRDRKTTSATISYTSESRTAREYIALDLSDYRSEGPVDVRLTITDDVSQQKVERSLQFILSEEP